jgi:hypothetical protein
MDNINNNKKKMIDTFLPYKEIEKIPEWQKQMWIELMSRNAKESWPYEKIINEYTALRESYYNIQDQYEKIKDSGEKNVILNDNISTIKNKFNEIKMENESLRKETGEIKLCCEKIKNENAELLNQLLKAKDIEAELQDKILELESKL